MPSNGTLAVLIPSRLQAYTDAETGHRHHFIERAIASVSTQRGGHAMPITFIAGIDADAIIPDVLASRPNLVFARSSGKSQAAALNTAIEAAGTTYDYVAFLEDDDRWEPFYLTNALATLAACDFVSTTQLEVDEEDRIIRINDFATPSGWMMPTVVLRRVGPFDTDYRWHLDNDWLGRLAKSGARRIHLVEATAPLTLPVAAQIRPWLANVLHHGGPSIALQRHSLLHPLILRQVHSGSGMAAIASEAAARQQSNAEYQRLTTVYGRIPW